MMKTAREVPLLIVLFLLSHLSEVRADDFVLLKSYPVHGQVLTTADLVNNPIYLKFNHPVDRSYLGVVRLLDKIGTSICQFNTCGVVNLEENDTKLTWHPNAAAELFQPGKFFEIHIGDPNPSVPPIPFAPVLLRDTFGNTLAATYIDFGVDKCQPMTGLKIIDNNVRTLHCTGGLIDFYMPGSGYAINLTAHISNPSCGSSLAVEGKVWLKLPDGSLMSVFDPFTTVQLSPGDTLPIDLLNYTFVGNEPPGNYQFSFRLLNPVTGDIHSAAATTGFSFGVCPFLYERSSPELVHDPVGDRLAEAYALVSVVEQGWAEPTMWRGQWRQNRTFTPSDGRRLPRGSGR